MLFLSSCKGKIICSQVKKAEIKPLMLFDISFQFNRCRGRCFDLNTWSNLPINQCIGESEFLPIIENNSVNYPLEYCDGIAGFTIEDMALNVRPNIKILDQIKKDNCN